MTPSSAPESAAGTRRTDDLQAFFNARKNFAERDDNTPWLITLADLLAILLVFSLVLFSHMMHTKDVLVSAPAKKDFAGSLVPVAEAGHAADPAVLSIPARLYHREKSAAAGSGDEEKIIARMTVELQETTGILNEFQRKELQHIADLLRLNPSTKIIITARMYDQTAPTGPRVQDIISFLTEHCGIDGRKIFFTSASSSAAARRALSGESIEVSLVKEFWSL